MLFFFRFNARGHSVIHPLKSHLLSRGNMEDLSKDFARCFTTRLADEKEIPAEDELNPALPSKETYNQIGRVVSHKLFSGLSLKMNITRLLQPVRGLTFQDLGHNRFILKSITSWIESWLWRVRHGSSIGVMCYATPTLG